MQTIVAYFMLVVLLFNSLFGNFAAPQPLQSRQEVAAERASVLQVTPLPTEEALPTELPMLTDTAFPTATLEATATDFVVGMGKDLVSSAAIFPWMFRDKPHERKAYGPRGWSPTDIDQTLRNPALTRSNVDKVTNQKVTYYYRGDGHYVVQNDVTGEIIHTSDTTDPGWIDPNTNLPIGPIVP